MSSGDSFANRSLIENSNLKENEYKILAYLSGVNEATTSEIERAVDLRYSEASSALKRLKDLDFVFEWQQTKKGKGRPAKSYQINISEEDFEALRGKLESEKSKKASNEEDEELIEYPISKYLRARLAGIVGEEVALEYVIEHLDKEEGDRLIIAGIKSEGVKRSRQGIDVRMFRQESVLEFISDKLCDYYMGLGKEAVTFKSKKVRDSYEEYSSRTKKEISKEIIEVIDELKTERGRELAEREEMLGEMEEETEPGDYYLSVYDEIIKTLPKLKKKDLVIFAVLLSALEDMRPNIIKGLTTFSRDGTIVGEVSEMRKILDVLTKYVNSRYENLLTLSKLYRAIRESNTKIDYVVVQLSKYEEIKKIIVIEAKAKGNKLTRNQKSFFEALNKEKIEKVEYKFLEVEHNISPKYNIISKRYP